MTTDRLIPTPIGPEHTADLIRLHSDPNVAYWNAGSWSASKAGDFAKEMRRRWSRDGVGKWIAHRRSDGALVGRGGLSLAVVDGQRRPELGWALRDAMRGQGVATEIGAAGLDFGFGVRGFQEIVANTEIHNVASRAVMERLDMTFVRIITAPGLVEGAPGIRDDAPFALYRIARPAASFRNQQTDPQGHHAAGEHHGTAEDKADPPVRRRPT
ncbi:GNAT family N-acetyltransferase [Nakamurella sp. GG22]